MGHGDKPGNLWSIVLAAGDGVRTNKSSDVGSGMRNRNNTVSSSDPAQCSSTRSTARLDSAC